MAIAVLGAGLQGVLCALELAELGHRVVIFDAASGALQKASLHNEGKIHLGYVYAKDASNRTAKLMAEGASRFAELLGRWWPVADMATTSSDPFDYLVMPESLEPADWIAGRYRQIDAIMAEQRSKRGRSDLGQKDIAPAVRLDAETAEPCYDGRDVDAVFRTDERAIDLHRMGNVNACLDRIDTPFFAFCLHDDALEPTFLELLRNALQNAPNAVVAHGGMLRFGTINAVVEPVHIGGTPMSRALGCLNNSFAASRIKNLMRSGPVQQGPRLPQMCK
jgi:hypothetical protein